MKTEGSSKQILDIQEKKRTKRTTRDERRLRHVTLGGEEAQALVVVVVVVVVCPGRPEVAVWRKTTGGRNLKKNE